MKSRKSLLDTVPFFPSLATAAGAAGTGRSCSVKREWIATTATQQCKHKARSKEQGARSKEQVARSKEQGARFGDDKISRKDRLGNLEQMMMKQKRELFRHTQKVGNRAR